MSGKLKTKIYFLCTERKFPLSNLFATPTVTNRYSKPQKMCTPNSYVHLIDIYFLYTNAIVVITLYPHRGGLKACYGRKEPIKPVEFI